ncbi:hypothetical protein CH376_05975 [Leptospira adleri]|uniref:Uncharacterized protein n=1 Tax=Leptospira adleri TaxID=2023186 RepID=A0ABX4P177_9LEPT|nr:hypothetical protein CH376_05975 [Leptospira adleri]
MGSPGEDDFPFRGLGFKSSAFAKTRFERTGLFISSLYSELESKMQKRKLELESRENKNRRLFETK